MVAIIFFLGMTTAIYFGLLVTGLVIAFLLTTVFKSIKLI